MSLANSRARGILDIAYDGATGVNSHEYHAGTSDQE